MAIRNELECRGSHKLYLALHIDRPCTALIGFHLIYTNIRCFRQICHIQRPLLLLRMSSLSSCGKIQLQFGISLTFLISYWHALHSSEWVGGDGDRNILLLKIAYIECGRRDWKHLRCLGRSFALNLRRICEKNSSPLFRRYLTRNNRWQFLIRFLDGRFWLC